MLDRSHRSPTPGVQNDPYKTSRYGSRRCSHQFRQHQRAGDGSHVALVENAVSVVEERIHQKELASQRQTKSRRQQSAESQGLHAAGLKEQAVVSYSGWPG